MLTKDEIERYSRQILLVGKNTQEKIKGARVLVLGAGGIGSSLLPYLVSSGIGYIRLLDPDLIEMSNLSRQIIYKPENVGALKGPTSVEYLQSINPDVEVDWKTGSFTNSSASNYLEGIDLILDGTDDIRCKFLVSDLSKKKGIPAIIGSIGNVQGHVFPVGTEIDHACYRCLFEEPVNPEEIPTCATEGILSPLPGIIGSMMAYIGLSFFIDNNMPKKVFLMEKNGWRTIQFKKNSSCDYCNNI